MFYDYGRVDPPCPDDQRWVRSNYLTLFQPFETLLKLPEGLSHEHYEWRVPGVHDPLKWTGRQAERLSKDGFDVERWHNDYGWRYVAVWSSNGPTEVRRRRGGNGRAWRAGTKHLVVFDNEAVFHRTGRFRYNHTTRHFMRIGIPPHLTWEPDESKLLDI